MTTDNKVKQIAESPRTERLFQKRKKECMQKDGKDRINQQLNTSQ